MMHGTLSTMESEDAYTKESFNLHWLTTAGQELNQPVTGALRN